MAETENKVIILRHADAAFPYDYLTDQGIARAKSKKDQFGKFPHVHSSSKRRTQQTAAALGYDADKVIIDPRLNELEFDDVKGDTPHEYVMKSYEIEPEEVQAIGQLMQLAVSQIGQNNQQALVISHNLAMSSLFYHLTQIKDSFGNLEGFEVQVNPGGGLTFVRRIS